MHGVEGAFSGTGAKTVIPAKVIGKFSIRTVPNMEPEDVDALVFKHLDSEWKKLGSNNTLKRELMHAGKWWVASPKHWNFNAAAKAVQKVFGVEPDFTREGGSIPVTLTFEQATGKNVLLLPMGSSTDGAHSINEKVSDMRCVLETSADSEGSLIAATILRAQSCSVLTCTTLRRRRWSKKCILVMERSLQDRFWSRNDSNRTIQVTVMCKAERP